MECGPGERDEEMESLFMIEGRSRWTHSRTVSVKGCRYNSGSEHSVRGFIEIFGESDRSRNT